MGSLTYASGFIGASLRGENPPVQEDFILDSAYCTGKVSLTMQALVRIPLLHHRYDLFLETKLTKMIQEWHAALYSEGFTVLAVHPGW